MSIDLYLLGSKLKRYREGLGLSFQELAENTGLAIGKLQSYELGKAEPSGDEILILADYYKCDFRFFISNETENVFDKIEMLFRKYGDELSSVDRWSIQEVVFLAECESFLDTELGIKKPQSFSYQPTGNYYIGHGKDGAKKLRYFLNERANIVNLNIYEDFRRIGMRIYRRSIENSKISGICINHPSLGILLLVNYDEDTYRQRFTIAHEVGHAIFDSSDEEPIISFSTKWSNDKLKERRADAFASEFLIPEEVIDVIPNNRNWDGEKLLLWANKLRVNTEPLLISLVEHNLIDNRAKEELSNYKISRTDKKDSELVGQSPLSISRMEFIFQKGLSREYIRKCSEAYHSGIISLNRMAEMLLVGIDELNGINDLFNIGIEK